MTAADMAAILAERERMADERADTYMMRWREAQAEIAGLRAARDAAFNEGVEAAAVWHDRQGRGWALNGGDFGQECKHPRYAHRIRALKSPVEPQAAPEASSTAETTEGASAPRSAPLAGTDGASWPRLWTVGQVEAATGAHMEGVFRSGDVNVSMRAALEAAERTRSEP